MACISQRLVGISGFNQRKNDVIFVPRQMSTEPASVVVFFGGDVQVGLKYTQLTTSVYYTSSLLLNRITQRT